MCGMLVSTECVNKIQLFDCREKIGYEETWVEEKPGKIQKIFQLSVTALAFLAFGGYLLCMIVQAIKSKGWLSTITSRSRLYSNFFPTGTTYYHPALMPMTSAQATSQISYKRKRPARIRRQTNNTNFLDEKSAGPSPDDMYKILLMAAEGYVKLNE